MPEPLWVTERWGTYKVTGNVFDNPELLEGGKVND